MTDSRIVAFPRVVSILDFWSLPQREVQLTDAVGDSHSKPSTFRALG